MKFGISRVQSGWNVTQSIDFHWFFGQFSTSVNVVDCFENQDYFEMVLILELSLLFIGVTFVHPIRAQKLLILTFDEPSFGPGIQILTKLNKSNTSLINHKIERQILQKSIKQLIFNLQISSKFLCNFTSIFTVSFEQSNSSELRKVVLRQFTYLWDDFS